MAVILAATIPTREIGNVKAGDQSPPSLAADRPHRDEAGGATPGFSAQQWTGYFDGTLGSDPMHQRSPAP
jgi:hypothetical protein